MHKAILIVSCLLFPLSLQAKDMVVPSFIEEHVMDARPVGEGRMRYMMMDIYDATLYASRGEWVEGEPFALSLVYLRDLQGEKIADRAIQEIRQQGFEDEIRLAAWHEQMSAIFPDVTDQTRLTGIYDGRADTIFYLEDKEIGRINDPEFGVHFFNIWLGPRSSDRELYAELTGDRL